MLRMASFTKLAGAAVPAAGEPAAAMPLGAWEGGEAIGLGGLEIKCGTAAGATRVWRSDGRVSQAPARFLAARRPQVPAPTASPATIPGSMA
jgi:hypothetical protein